MDDLEVADEVGVHGKVDISLLLFKRIDALGAQLMRLPNDIIVPGSNMPSGITYDDIKQSYIDGVEHLTQLVLTLADEKEELDEEVNDFKAAKKQFGKIVKLLNRKNMLYALAKTGKLDEDDEGNYYGKEDADQAHASAPEDDQEAAV